MVSAILYKSDFVARCGTVASTVAMRSSIIVVIVITLQLPLRRVSTHYTLSDKRNRKVESNMSAVETHFATKSDLKALEARLLWAIFGVAILAAILAQTILG